MRMIGMNDISSLELQHNKHPRAFVHAIDVSFHALLTLCCAVSGHQAAAGQRS